MRLFAILAASFSSTLIGDCSCFAQDANKSLPNDGNAAASWVSGIVTGVLIAAATQYISNWFQWHRGLREKVVGWHAELIGLLGKDIQRAKRLAAFIAMYPSRSETDSAHIQEFVEANEDQRLDNRENLVRIAFQIQILETDSEILTIVRSLSEMQPILKAIHRADPAYPEALSGFDEAIDKYKSTAEKLADKVKQGYARRS